MTKFTGQIDEAKIFRFHSNQFSSRLESTRTEISDTSSCFSLVPQTRPFLNESSPSEGLLTHIQQRAYYGQTRGEQHHVRLAICISAKYRVYYPSSNDEPILRSYFVLLTLKT